MEKQKKSGFIALVGRPNVGKSTLMNHLIGQKIAITSRKPQTTRNQIRTVYTDERGQAVFLDTPGIHKAQNRLGTYMVEVAQKTFSQADIVMWLVEPTTFIGRGEQEIAKKLRQLKCPVFLIVNKTDTVKKEAVAEVKAAEQPKKEEKKPVAAAKAPEKKPANKPVVNRTVRVDIEKLDSLMNLVSELIIAKNSLVAASSNDQGNNSAFNEQIEYLENVTTNLHESVMKVRMVPIESVVVKFPRMIRDLSKKLDKKMELYMTGEETELDRTVVDEIGDPLMHLLRNSADHGLESAEVRAQRGKPEQGSIFLDAYQDGASRHTVKLQTLMRW